MAYLKDLIATRELLGNLVAREVKGQYRRTVLGQLWSLLNPIAMMIVYSIVFGLIFRATPEPGVPSGLDIYPLWLMCGLLPWLYFRRVVDGVLDSLVVNSGLIKKVYFPRMHLPLAVTLSTGFTWAVELGVLMVALHFFGGLPVLWLPALLGLMALLALAATGLGMLLAILNVHFRDTKHFTAILMQMWMFLTPIIYPLSLVAESTREHPWVLRAFGLNPMEHFIAAFRRLLYDNTWPAVDDVVWCVAVAVTVFAAGYLVFVRAERRLAEQL
jgi:ABC-type polysaccharide/polyol phosphate export permease